MSVSRCAILAVILFIIISWTMSIISFHIDLRYDGDISVTTKKPSAPYPDGKFDNIFWFMQITDLHISRFYDKGRPTDLKQFCTQYIDIFKPTAVLVTGDLTDAKHANGYGSEQYVDEWQVYDKILTESKVTEKTLWLDVRGNHDSFNVPSLNSFQNYYKKYSIQKKLSYKKSIKLPYGRYTFIAMDACPDPGPKRPFNFFGMLNKTQLSDLEELAADTDSSNMTIWFGHYPTSVIASEQPGPSYIMRNGAAYLCGHFHTMGGFLPRLYTKQKTGNLELELGDWRDNRLYRLLAIDHDMLSFTDVTLGTWPVVMVTNPKHALFNMPRHESLGRMLKSTHIRILAFSTSDILSVKVSIDGVYTGQASHAGGPLFVLPWQPTQYSEGIHTISVQVKDTQGRENTINQPFTLNTKEKLYFDLLPRLVLMANLELVSQLIFIATFLLATLPLIFCRLYGPTLLPGQLAHKKGCSGCLLSLIQDTISNLYHVAQVDGLFYTLVGFATYISCGPWFIGEVLDDHIGFCFAFGIYVDGKFLPTITTYAYATLQMLLFNIPLTLCLGNCLRKNQFINRGTRTHTATWVTFLANEWPFMVVVLYQAYSAFCGFYLAYGGMAFILGFVKSWSVIIALVLRKKTVSITHKKPPMRTLSNGKAHLQNGVDHLNLNWGQHGS